MNNLISKNRILKNQSAGNSNGGTSETLREKSLKQQQIPRYIEESKLDYIAGVIDGDGNFDVRNSSSGEKTRILNHKFLVTAIYETRTKNKKWKQHSIVQTFSFHLHCFV